MKKIVFLLAPVILMAGCTKMDCDSLMDTTWKSPRFESDNGWHQDVLIFSSGEASYVRKTDNGSTGEPITGEYTYDHPTVTINYESFGMDGNMHMRTAVGKVKRKTMTIEIMTGDIIWSLELKKQ